MTAVGDTLLLFGGKMKNGSLSNQLWQYNISGEILAGLCPQFLFSGSVGFRSIHREISMKRNIQGSLRQSYGS
jgi:hypothetical protein